MFMFTVSITKIRQDHQRQQYRRKPWRTEPERESRHPVSNNPRCRHEHQSKWHGIGTDSTRLSSRNPSRESCEPIYRPRYRLGACSLYSSLPHDHKKSETNDVDNVDIPVEIQFRNNKRCNRSHQQSRDHRGKIAPASQLY